jgi:hypothetical protein
MPPSSLPSYRWSLAPFKRAWSPDAEKIVRALTSYGLTQADIPTPVGVSSRSVRNWLNDGPLRRGPKERLQDLRQIVLLLDDTLSARGVGQWFLAHHRLLGGQRLLGALAEGRFDDLRRAAAAFADGSHV